MTEKLQNALNEQITAELWSANLYLSMSFYLEREGFSGMARWMQKQLVQVASEEKDNATQDFLWQFVREQVEDEANVLNIVSHLRKAGDCAILFMDAKLGERES